MTRVDGASSDLNFPNARGCAADRTGMGYRQHPWSGRLRGLLPRGSHGSGHADFPHPALRSTASLRGGGEDVRLRKRIVRQQPCHFLPRHVGPLRAAI